MKKIVCLMLMVLLLTVCAAMAEGETCPILMQEGGSFTLVRAADGTVWGWGDNRSGQIGVEKLKLQNRPIPAATGLDGTQIVDIQCGNENTVYLMADGTVYTSGANSKAQGGQGHNKSCLKVPTKVETLENIVAISSGFGHCMALDKDGHVWAWGRNDKGQVGDGTRSMATSPVMIEGLENIAQISCGGTYSMALGADGTLYGWGESDYGQLRFITTKMTTTPVVIPMDGVNIVQLECGGDSAYVLDDNGRVLCWGRNDFRQLGRQNTSHSPYVELIEVELPEDVKVKRVIAYNSHTAAITEDDNLWIWGNTGAGQQGTGVFYTCIYPMLVHADGQVLDAAVGSQMSGMVLKDGSVWITGYNKYGQLGCMPGRSAVTAWTYNGLNVLTGELEKVK